MHFQETAGKRPRNVAIMQQLSAALTYFPAVLLPAPCPRADTQAHPGEQVATAMTATPYALVRATRADETSKSHLCLGSEASTSACTSAHARGSPLGPRGGEQLLHALLHLLLLVPGDRIRRLHTVLRRALC